MANKVNQTPNLPSPIILQTVQNVTDYLTNLIQSLTSELSDHALRLNTALVNDGTEISSAPILMKEYLKTALPSAVKYKGGMIMVSNDTGGYTPAFSDGTSWRRVADRNVIS